MECLRLCFGTLLQNELQAVADEWNYHRIRNQKNLKLPTGKHNVLYFLPKIYGAKNYGKTVDVSNVQTCAQLFTENPELHSPQFKNLLDILLPGTKYPKDVDEA